MIKVEDDVSTSPYVTWKHCHSRGYVLVYKKREREAEWRKEKLAYYKAFIHSLSGVVQGDATDEGRRLFAQTSNDMLLFAPPKVLNALYGYKDEVSLSNIPNRSVEREKALLTTLIHEIRIDLGISTGTAPGFTAQLWCSGVGKV